jgi:hypothetical protein
MIGPFPDTIVSAQRVKLRCRREADRSGFTTPMVCHFFYCFNRVSIRFNVAPLKWRM